MQVLKDATDFFSSNSPNISAVIPAMDAIDEQFATGIVEGRELSMPLKQALAIGKRTLNKYYALTDASDIYRMAMGTSLILSKDSSLIPIIVLHPSYKTTYFTRLSWSRTWINEAIKVTRDSWKAYKPLATTSESQTPAASVRTFFSLNYL